MTQVTITLSDNGDSTNVEHDIEERYDPENPSGALYYGNAILLFLMEFGGFQALDVDSNNEFDGLPEESEHPEAEIRLPEEPS